MKFGKQFRLQMKPEWESIYFDYKMLKHFIREGADEESFRIRFDSQFSKVEEFLKAKLRESHEEVAQARQYVQSNIQSGHQYNHARHRGASPRRTRKEPSDSETPQSTGKRIIREKEEDLNSKRPRVEESEAAAKVVEVEKEVEKVVGKEQNGESKVTTNENEGGTHNQILDCSQLLEDLRSFVISNSTACQKILKKYDKRNGSHLTEVYKESLESTILWGRHELEDLYLEIAEMTKLLPKSEQAPRKSKLDISFPDVPILSGLNIHSLPSGEKTLLKISLGVDALAEPLTVPVMVAKGSREGPIVGITSAVHGNELNGIPIIHKLWEKLDCSTLCGTVVAIPVVNTPGYVRHQRNFSDGQDLNRIMPGKNGGNSGQSFAHKLIVKIVRHFNFLIDLHTASFGRVNSLYVRADMNDQDVFRIAMLQNPEIIVHNTGPDGSLRGAAMTRGIPAVTVEVGNPSIFHHTYINSTVNGIENILSFLKMIPSPQIPSVRAPVLCSCSKWFYAKSGGVLYVFPKIATWVRKGDVIAEITDLFGRLMDRFLAPEDAVVIGKSVNPVCATGDRIIHLGFIESDTFPDKALDGHE